MLKCVCCNILSLQCSISRTGCVIGMGCCFRLSNFVHTNKLCSCTFLLTLIHVLETTWKLRLDKKKNNNNKRNPSRDHPLQTRRGRLNSGNHSPFRQYITPQRKQSTTSNSSSLFHLEDSTSRHHSNPHFPRDFQVKRETVASASVSPDNSPTPVPKNDFLAEQSKEFLFNMSKGDGFNSGSAGSGSSRLASDLLYVCSTSGIFSSSFATVEKAKATITDFLISISALKNVPRSLYDELVDLLVKTRNLRWSSLKFQLLTLPKDTSNGDVIALQTLINMCPELKPRNRQTAFGLI